MLRLQIQRSDGGWTWASVLADEGSDTNLVWSNFTTLDPRIALDPQRGTGGVVMSFASELIHFQLSTEFRKIV